jgi:hypothetical protein
MAKQFPRTGAWVTMGDRVGILAAIEGDDAEVHFTNEQGETAEVARGVPIASLTQAARMEIPKKRRPPADVAKQLGYTQGGG